MHAAAVVVAVVGRTPGGRGSVRLLRVSQSTQLRDSSRQPDSEEAARSHRRHGTVSYDETGPPPPGHRKPAQAPGSELRQENDGGRLHE